MQITLKPGRYVVAVSGGVDSVALLHMLRDMPDLDLTVAHYDHGIRADSGQDRELVQATAQAYGLPFVYHEGKLGSGTSEATARAARYGFLHDIRRATQAQAIITAHHQDDVLETIILNLLRGTGRRGLHSLKSTDTVRRPLLAVPKKQLLRYAAEQGLSWREDSTNADEKYLRNYIRSHIMPRFADTDREALLKLSGRASELSSAIGQHTINYLHLQPSAKTLHRHDFIMLPHAVAREILAEWLLQNSEAELSKKLLERIVVAAKTGRIGSHIDIDTEHWLYISKDTLALKLRER